MTLRKTDYAALGLVVAALGASAALYGQLPEQVAIHFNADGQPDNTMARPLAAVLLPAFALGTYGLLKLVPRIDPLGENVDSFRDVYEVFVVVVVALLAYVHGLVLAWNLGYAFDVAQVIAPALAAVFYVSGVLMARAERNWFIGIRTPWTLSSDEVWRQTHDRAAPLFKALGVVALLGLVVPQYLLYVVVAPAVLVAVYTTVYSYRCYHRLDNAEDALAAEGNA